MSKEALDDALTAAEDYRAVIDRRHELALDHFLDETHRALARLYASVMSLPEPDPTDREFSRPPHEVWATLYTDLQGLLGKWDRAREIFDPYEDENEPPVMGSVADDLASVYVTCTHVLRIVTDASPDDVAWELAFGFEVQDGHYALDAMRAIAAQRTHRE